MGGKGQGAVIVELGLVMEAVVRVCVCVCAGMGGKL